MSQRGYYKNIKKDNEIYEDLKNGVGIYVESVETSTDGFYDIYIAGTVLGYKDKKQTDYFIAKHSTLYNYTEWHR